MSIHREDIDTRIGPEGYSDTTRLPSLGTLKGMQVRDHDGDKVGKVSDVYLDSDAEFVRYLSIKTGWFDKEHIIPVDDVSFVEEDGDGHVVVPYTSQQLKSAPTFGKDDELTAEREREIYDYYERVGYWDETRDAVRARQTAPAPTERIAEAEVEDAVSRGSDPRNVRVKRWGV